MPSSTKAECESGPKQMKACIKYLTGSAGHWRETTIIKMKYLSTRMTELSEKQTFEFP